MNSAIIPPSGPWCSLRTILVTHSPADIATAIEQYGIWFIDRYNRRVKASIEPNEANSQDKALDLVAEWQAELNDPGPTYSWNHQRFELEEHPAERFGWPQSDLPNFSAHTKSAASKKSYSSKTTLSRDQWIQVAQQEAFAILKSSRQQGLDPKQDYLAKEVTQVLATKGVRTSRGDITWQNVKREALAGDWWRKTRQIQKV